MSWWPHLKQSETPCWLLSIARARGSSPTRYLHVAASSPRSVTFALVRGSKPLENAGPLTHSTAFSLLPPHTSHLVAVDSTETATSLPHVTERAPNYRSLLLISGDRDSRITFTRIAKRWRSARLLVADGGRTGLHMVLSRQPELVVLDAHLPDATASLAAPASAGWRLINSARPEVSARCPRGGGRHRGSSTAPHQEWSARHAQDAQA